MIQVTLLKHNYIAIKSSLYIKNMERYKFKDLKIGSKGLCNLKKKKLLGVSRNTA
jgi:hypothetical protein